MAGFGRATQEPEAGSGLTLVDFVPTGFERAKFSNPFLDMAGPYYVRPDDDGIVVGTRIHKGQINHINVAHGGVLGTLADVALSLQVHESERPRLPVATMNLNTNYLAAAKLDDWVEAHCRIDRMSKRTAY